VIFENFVSYEVLHALFPARPNPRGGSTPSWPISGTRYLIHFHDSSSGARGVIRLVTI